MTGLLAPLGILLVPAFLCALLAVTIKGDAAANPIILVAVVGGVIAGFVSGFLLASRWVRDPGGRVVVGFFLGVVCSVASFVAGIAGCVAGVAAG